MKNSFYNHLAFIYPESNVTIEDVKISLEEFYTNKKIKPSIMQSDNDIVLKFDNYKFHIHLSKDKHVIEEAREIAEDRNIDWADKKFDKELLKQSSSRLEIWGEEDFDMDYFNDSLLIVETIGKLDGLTIFEVN